MEVTRAKLEVRLGVIGAKVVQDHHAIGGAIGCAKMVQDHGAIGGSNGLR